MKKLKIYLSVFLTFLEIISCKQAPSSLQQAISSETNVVRIEPEALTAPHHDLSAINLNEEPDDFYQLSFNGVKRFLIVPDSNLNLTDLSDTQSALISTAAISAAVLGAFAFRYVHKNLSLPSRANISEVKPIFSFHNPHEKLSEVDNSLLQKFPDGPIKAVGFSPFSASQKITLGRREFNVENHNGAIEDINFAEGEKQTILALPIGHDFIKKNLKDPNSYYINADNKIFVRIETDDPSKVIVQVRNPDVEGLDAAAQELIRTKMSLDGGDGEIFIPHLAYAKDPHFLKKTDFMKALGSMDSDLFNSLNSLAAHETWDFAFEGKYFKVTNKENLGAGTYGSILGVKVEVDGVSFNLAIKKELISSAATREIIGLASNSGHPNSVGYYGSVVHTTEGMRNSYSALERLDSNLMSSGISAFGTKSIPEKIRIFREASQAVAYMHSKGMVHADLKAGNMGLGADGHARIIDYGLSRPAAQKRFTGTYMCGADLNKYRAGTMDGPKFDVFAFGVAMLEGLGKYDKIAYSRRTVADGICTGGCPHMSGATIQATPKAFDGIDPKLSQLIKECVADDSSLRPSMADVVARLKTIETRFAATPL